MDTNNLILDIGNVLLTVDMEKIYKKITEEGFTRNVDEAQTFMKSIENVVNIGITDLRGAMDMVFGLGFDSAKQRISDYWCSDKCVYKNEKILQYLNQLLEKDFTKVRYGAYEYYRTWYTKIAFASNLGTDHYNYIKTVDNFFSSKKVLHCCSFNIGAAKPQFLFFSSAEEILSRQGFFGDDNVTIYVDDKTANLDGAYSSFSDDLNIYLYNFDSSKQKESEFIETINSFLHHDINITYKPQE